MNFELLSVGVNLGQAHSVVCTEIKADHDLQGCVCLVAARTQDGTASACPADAHGHGAWDRWNWQGQTGAPITFMGMRGAPYYRPWAGQYYYQATRCGRQSPVSVACLSPQASD